MSANCLLLQWDEQAPPTGATLSDSVTSIHAIFSSEFLEDLPKNEKDKLNNVRKNDIRCRLELLEFELVLEYIKSQPAIHLFVEAFSFVDNPGLVNGNVATPTSLDEIPDIRYLIDKAIIQAHVPLHIRNRRTNGGLEPEDKPESGDESEYDPEDPDSGDDYQYEEPESEDEPEPKDEPESNDQNEAGDGYDSDESLMSQPVNPVATDNHQAEPTNTFQSQEAFATQVPPAQSSFHLHDQVPAPPNAVVPPAQRNELLGLLQKPRDVERRQETESPLDSPANEESSVKPPKNVSPAKSASTSQVTNDGPNYEGTTNNSLKTQEPSDHQESQGARDSPHNRTSPSPPMADSALRDIGNSKNHSVSETLVQADSDHESREPSAPAELPRPSREQLEESDSQIAGQSLKRRQQSHAPTIKNFDPSDPWEGMTKIRRSDVMIPKDQMELLAKRDCWIPAEPGQITPRCHVPPKLLQKWNEMISRKRSRSISDNVSEYSHSVNAEPALPSVSSSALQPESESDEESEQIPWSPSPEPTKQLVPPDSSPLQPRESTRRADGPAVPHVAIAVEVPPPDYIVGDARNRPCQNEVNDSEDRHNVASQSKVNEAEQDIRSDPSEMEVSVPCALDAAVQADINSQVEDQEITSSGLSLPAPTATEKIQVIETPDEGFRSKRMNIDHLSPRGSTQHQSSSEVTKTSSQSRIANSYDSNGCAVGADQDPFARTQSSVGDKGTQNSGSDRPDLITMSHPGTLASAEEFPTDSGFSLDFNISSQPVASGMSGLSGISSGPEHDLPAPSQLFKLSQIGPQSQPDVPASSICDGSTQDSARMDVDVAPVTSRKRPADEAALSEQSSPKRPRPAPTSHNDITSDNYSENLRSGPLNQRKSGSSSDTNRDKAREVYDKFKRDYPSYTGDFNHFTKVCSKLQALRNRGLMQRSFLWDDFIIQHLTDYARYWQQCLSAVEEPQNYENYFCDKFDRPACKKRSLTARGIEVVASQCPSRASVDSVPFVVRAEANTSFTGSLVEKLAGLRAHSSPTAPPHEIQESMHDAPADDDTTDGDTDDDDGTGERHETASIELGDEENVPVRDPGEVDRAISPIRDDTHGSDRDTEESSESEEDHSEDASESSSEEGDKRQSRTLADLLLAPPPPPGPVWSDSPNTPFKIWARGDQNLLIERRRRGGAAMPTDEKGVIQPPLYPREGWEDGMRTLGWNWKKSRDYS